MIFQILDIPTLKVEGNLFNLTAHDSGSPYWLPYLQPYLDAMGATVMKVEFTRLDLSKPWILSLAPNSWNWDVCNSDFLEIFEPEVRNELVNGNGYLLINHEAESFTTQSYKDIHRFLTYSKLSPKKVIYLVGAVNPEQQYKKFVELHQIPKDQQIQIISSFHVHRRYGEGLAEFIEQSRVQTKKDKKFLSLNRVPRLHRVMMVSLLAEYNLLDHGYVSLGLHPDDLIDKQFYSDFNEIPPYSNFSSLIKNGFKKIAPNLPLQVDEVDLRQNQYNVQSLPSIFYDKTYFSIVSSTFALRQHEPCVGFTEKEMKPILYKQPFLMHNLHGGLRELKKMGFLSFDRWFDESYDEEINDTARLHKLVLEVKRLCELSDEQWDRMLEEMQPVLLHNYNILIKYNKEHIFFHSDLKNLIHYVS